MASVERSEKMKEYIVFYKEDNHNVAISTGKDFLMNLIPYPEKRKQIIFEEFHESKNNLFISVDGIEYKID